MKLHLVILSILFDFALSRDFYVGMFKKNDLLVAQDTLYKESERFGFTTAKYGRKFNCPITYFRVADRLGSKPPRVEIIRGGLLKTYIVLRLTGFYGQPIAVNIYVGCENKMTTTTPTTTPPATTKPAAGAAASAGDAGETTKTGDDAGNTAAAGESETTTGAAAEDAKAPAEGGEGADAAKPTEGGGSETTVAEGGEEVTTPAPA